MQYPDTILISSRYLAMFVFVQTRAGMIAIVQCIFGMTNEFVAQSVLLHIFVTDLHDAFDYPKKK